MAARHVFVSYCTEDREEVRKLVEGLEQRGEAVWWDQKMKLGQVLEQAIHAALEDSYAAVLCFSSASAARRTSWVFPEYEKAIGTARKHAPGESFLFTVRLDPCEVPIVLVNSLHSLRDMLHVDCFSTDPPAIREEALDRLAEAIKTSPLRP